MFFAVFQMINFGSTKLDYPPERECENLAGLSRQRHERIIILNI